MRDQEIRSAIESCSCELKHIVSVSYGSQLAALRVLYEGRFLFLRTVADFSEICCVQESWWTSATVVSAVLSLATKKGTEDNSLR